ncbi:hypothetical protein F4778DRAFT_708657 [Xylariomycetidae sp. FL2044]|nr:hypothetical protein F4778DRAFT_708657 [Xylariomycetidae sp. FL2044]
MSAELRLRIWGFVAPEVQFHRGPQVFTLQLIIPDGPESGNENAPPYHIRPGPALKHQTRGVRTMLAVHQESRAEALKFFPDVLTIDDERGGIVRYDSDHDMVFLDGKFDAHWMQKSSHYSIEGFTDSVQHLGLGPDLHKFLTFYVGPDVAKSVNPRWILMKFLRPFHCLGDVWWCVEEHRDESDYDMRWCASDKVNRYQQSWPMDDSDPAEKQAIIYCWPDLDHNHTYASNERSYYVGVGEEYGTEEFNMSVDLLQAPDGWPADVKARIHEFIDPHLDAVDLWRLSEVEFWHMRTFSTARAVRRFHRLDPNCEEADEVDTDQYLDDFYALASSSEENDSDDDGDEVVGTSHGVA